MNSVGIFCEDIREEVGGTHTILGVMPDNVHLGGKPPGTNDTSILIPKMGFYVRLNLETNGPIPREVAAEVAIPGRDVIKLGALSSEGIEKAFKDSVSNKLPFVGVIFKAAVSPLPIPKSGIAELRVRIDGRMIVCGTLNIVFVDAT